MQTAFRINRKTEAISTLVSKRYLRYAFSATFLSLSLPPRYSLFVVRCFPSRFYFHRYSSRLGIPFRFSFRASTQFARYSLSLPASLAPAPEAKSYERSDFHIGPLSPRLCPPRWDSPILLISEIVRRACGRTLSNFTAFRFSRERFTRNFIYLALIDAIS